MTLLITLLSTTAAASDWRADDFAFGFTVEADEEKARPLLNLDLPDAVYSGVVRSDLGDIRVFNAQGETVPHVIRRPPGIDADAPPPRALPFFPLYAGQPGSPDKRVLQIVTDDKGTIVSAASEHLDSDAAKRGVAYLVDASALDKGPNRLVLDWPATAPEGFAVTVDVLASDDLSHWRTLSSGATLADLRSDDAALVHNEIVLPGRKTKYLRIDWPDEIREIQPTQVTAHFVAEQMPPPRQWRAISGTWQEETDGGWNFNGDGYRPVDRVRMQFDQANVLMHGTLYSRATRDGTWRQRYTGVFYDLQHAGARLKNDPISLGPTTDPFWRFAVKSTETTPAGEATKLEIGWIPHRLTFLARGSPPFTVAFGNATATPAELPMEALLQGIAKTQEEGISATARSSAIFTLGGEGKLRPPPTPLAWKTWLLWGVLLSGVLLLALMVRSLLRQLGSARK